MVERLPHSNLPPGPEEARPPRVQSRCSVRLNQGTPNFAALAGNLVHLWAAPLNLPADQLEHFHKVLSEAELDRANRFHFEVHRNRYIASHAWLRLVLSQYLDVAPQRLEFHRGPKGKPFLINSGREAELQFNLGHSEDVALIGVGRGLALGVDVERIRELEDAQELVDRFFSARESAAFQALAEDHKATAFFNLWTRKEAWLKATGEGIAHLLNQVEVSFVPSEPARLVALPASYSSAQAWSIRDINLGQEFAAAVALAADDVRPELYWTMQLNPIGL